MRIGIVSLKVNENYGGLLQAWALQQVLMRMGHEPVLLDSRKEHDLSCLQKMLIYPVRGVKKYVLRSNSAIRREQLAIQAIREYRVNIQPFIDKRLEIKTITSLDRLRKSDFDAYVFGSDQVWRPEYFRWHFGSMANAFGYFARNWNKVKLASYAASFGIDSLKEYESEELTEIRSFLPRFRGVSVRETSGVELCRQLGVEATHVLDPTMLLGRSDYLELIADSSVPPRLGIMTYILDQTAETDMLIKKVSKKTRLPLFSAKSAKDEPPQSVESWLAAIKDAELVVTDSFHACVFSIIFNKPFIVVENPVRGTARIDSLLGTFDLDGHKILPSDPLPDDLISTFTFNNCRVSDKLETMRKTSFEFLKNALS